VSDPEPPRFPYVAALLCAACLGAAGCLWLKYSYCWDVTARDLHKAGPMAVLGIWDGSYVRFHGWKMSPDTPDVPARPTKWRYKAGYNLDYYVLLASNDRAEVGTPSLPTAPGRVTIRDGTIIVDRTRGRFAGESIAGIVVAAACVLVFGAALGRWLKERYRSWKRDRAAQVPAPTSPGDRASERDRRAESDCIAAGLIVAGVAAWVIAPIFWVAYMGTWFMIVTYLASPLLHVGLGLFAVLWNMMARKTRGRTVAQAWVTWIAVPVLMLLLLWGVLLLILFALHAWPFWMPATICAIVGVAVPVIVTLRWAVTQEAAKSTGVDETLAMGGRVAWGCAIALCVPLALCLVLIVWCML
jgi:hypothetical protein